MPNMSDTARKRVLADWVVKTKKQVVKLYAVTKWARDADTVQKCMVCFLLSTSLIVSNEGVVNSYFLIFCLSMPSEC